MTVKDRSSRPADVSFGVSQGAVLGPILFILYSALLSPLIKTHSVFNQSVCLWHTTSSLMPSWSDTRHCSDHADMHLRRDDLDETKQTESGWRQTEAVRVKSNRTIPPNAQPTSLRVGSADSPFTTCARNLGFKISDNMSLDKHILNVCRSAYLSDLLTVYTPSRQLRSSADTRALRIAHVKTKTSGQRPFPYSAPTQWNSLPSHPSHSALPCLQNCNKWFRFCLLYFLTSLTPFSHPGCIPLSTLPHMCVCACVCVCMSVCVWCARNVINYNYIYFFRLTCIFVSLTDFVKRSVLTNPRWWDTALQKLPLSLLNGGTVSSRTVGKVGLKIFLCSMIWREKGSLC